MSTREYPAEERQLLQKIVSHDGFSRLAEVGALAWQEVAVLVGAYVAFALSSALYIAGLIPYTISFLINGAAIYAVFTPLHDATHYAASASRRVNDWIGNAAAFLLVPGFTAALYRYLHLEHHRFTGDKTRDPDESFASASRILLPIIWCCPDLIWVAWYFRHRKGRPDHEQAWFWLGLAFSAAWHAAWLSSEYGWEFVLLWMLPQRLGLGLVVYLFAYLQHPEDVDQREYPFQATRMIRGGVVARYLFFGQSEHLMHHLFPSIPFYRYHEAWRAGGYAVAGQGTAWQWPLTTLQRPKLPTRRPAAQTLSVRVRRVQRVAEDVIAFELCPASGGVLPDADAGSHIDLHLGNGVVRQYSLCADPADRTHYRIAVKREPEGRGGSRQIHTSIKEGAVVEITGPRNLFALSASAKRYMLIAGGIGITPLMAMAHSLQARGVKFTMHVCARSRNAMPFAEELRLAPFADRVRAHLDDGPQEQRFGANALPIWQPGDEMYLCGPQAFMDWVIAEARSRDWPESAIKTESFGARATHRAPTLPFELVLARTGRILSVGQTESALLVLQKNRVAVAASCTQGICGACVTPVLSGEVDHRDCFLSESERAQSRKMAVCVSRARGLRVTLDL